MTMIASLGPDLPQDLLAATGVHAGLLPWDIDRETPAADRWLESKFPRWTYSVLQDWLDGRLDHLDAVVFSRADDGAQRLYYYISELRRLGEVGGPEPLIFDVAKIGRASSAQHMVASVRKLADRLGVGEIALERGIAETNVRRANVTAAADAQPGRVCLIAGTPPPDRRLHGMVERAGWIAAGETLGDAWADPGPPVEEGTGDPFAALARQLHARRADVRAFFDRAQALEAQADECGALAAVLWFAEEDDARVWHLPAQRDVLARIDIPALILTRRDWRANDGVEAEIAAFLQGGAA